MGPTLSKGTLDVLHLVVLIYIPSIFIFSCFLGPLISYLRVPILALTPMLPSVIQYHTSRFIGVVERRASLHPFPCGSTNPNLKVSQRCPIDQIIYHLITFGQLLLFVGLNIWILLVTCFLDAYYNKHDDSDMVNKFFIRPSMAIVLIYVWIIAATGRLGEIKWWPSRDHPLSRLVPSSIKNATMTKCRWT
jgi:hypothetical protein